MGMDEARKRKWYSEEAVRIITEADEDLLYEILRSRDAVCALYARATRQLTDKFSDSLVVDWLDANTEHIADHIAELEKLREALREAIELVEEAESIDDPQTGVDVAYRLDANPTLRWLDKARAALEES